jgi:hypothetical protein
VSRWFDRLAELRASPGASGLDHVVVSLSDRLDRRPTAHAASEDWTDEHDERAGIIEHEGGAPTAWAEALARLDVDRAPHTVPAARWRQFVQDCAHFMDEWAMQAAGLGWTPLDLFGCDRHHPLLRIERAGLLWQVNGGRVGALSQSIAVVASRQGLRTRLYRTRSRFPGEVVLPWELAA